METEQQHDEQLWKLAAKRAAFKKHLSTYFVINSFFWGLWWFSDDQHSHGAPWPIWPMLGWGIGIAFGYFSAYHDDKAASTKKEYEKLKKERGEK